MVSERDAQVIPLRQRMEKRITDYEREVAANARAKDARDEIGSVKVMADPLTVREGFATAPERPGHGIDFDWNKLAAHAV